jgi:hypothetical protein
MEDRKDVVINMGEIKSLDPDEIEETEDEEDLPRPIPTGEGLGKQEARTLLIQEMNLLIQKTNNTNRIRYKKRLDEYWEKKTKGLKAGLFPRDPFYYSTYTARHINQAVYMARHRGGYEQLLAAAGYGPRQHR